MKFKDHFSIQRSYDNFVIVTHGADGYKKHRVQADNYDHAVSISEVMFRHLLTTHGFIVYECDRYGNDIDSDLLIDEALYENGWTA